MISKLWKLSVVVAVMMMSTSLWACQDCGCGQHGGSVGTGYSFNAGPMMSGCGGDCGCGQADYGDPMANCGRAITNAAAAGLWAGYCTDNCAYQGSCGDSGGCKLGGLFKNRKSLGNFGGCGGGCLGGGGGVVSGYAADYGCGAPAGFANCEPAAQRSKCKLFGGGGGGKLRGRRGGGGGLFGGGGGGSCGCDSGCFGWPTNCGCGSGFGNGGGGGLFAGKRGGAGCGLFGGKRGGGGCGLFGGKRSGGGCFSKIFQRKSRGQDFYFNEFAGADYGQVDFQSSVAGSLTGACGCGQGTAMPMNVYDANIPMGEPTMGGSVMDGSTQNGAMNATVGSEVQAIDGSSSVMGVHGDAMEAADSAVNITGEAVEAIQDAVQSGGN